MLNARKVKNTSGGGKKAPLIEAGAYPARVVQVIDLGVQKQEFQGEVKPPKNDIWVTYELVDEFMPGEDGEPDESKPRWQSERFPLNNLDSDLARSTKRYYAIDPNEEEGGDWTKLIGRPVLVTIIVRGEYNNVGGASSMRAKEAAKLPDLVNPSKVFTMDDPDIEVFNSLPTFLQDIIKEGLEFEGSKLDKLLNGGKSVKKEAKKEEVEDEIPFVEDKNEEEDW